MGLRISRKELRYSNSRLIRSVSLGLRLCLNGFNKKACYILYSRLFNAHSDHPGSSTWARTRDLRINSLQIDEHAEFYPILETS